MTGEAPVPDVLPATQLASPSPNMHDLDINDLIIVLDDILGDKMDKDKRESLEAAVRRIVYFETKKRG